MREPGVAAMWPGICEKCESVFGRGDRIVPKGAGYIHTQCAPGGDDE